MDFFSNFHEILNRKIKVEKKITQSGLANKLNVSPVSVNKWLNGGSIELSKIPSLCVALDITPNELFGFNTKKDEEKALELYKAFLNHPEYQQSIKKLLNL